MIKLITILSEIKIRGRITPEIIGKLYFEILDKEFDEEDIDMIEKFEKEFQNILSKYINPMDTPNEDFGQIQKLHPKKLNNLYQDLINFQQNNDINEIRIEGRPKVTPELVDRLIDDTFSSMSVALGRRVRQQHLNIQQYYRKEYYKLEQIFNKYRIIWSIVDSEENLDYLRRLPQSKLNNLYKELLKLKKGYDSLQEIKIRGRITPEMVEKLINQYNTWEYNSKLVNIITKHGLGKDDNYKLGINGWLKILNQQELNSLYIDLLNIEKNNI